jgi:hypothetical protein
MRLDIHSPDLPFGAEHRAQAERLVGFALSRLNGLVQRVELRVGRAAGGSRELACRVQVHLVGTSVVVDDSGADLSALIQRSVARAGQAAQRHLAASRRGGRAWPATAAAGAAPRRPA